LFPLKDFEYIKPLLFSLTKDCDKGGKFEFVSLANDFEYMEKDEVVSLLNDLEYIEAKFELLSANEFE
jgi:hypothetical protein